MYYNYYDVLSLFIIPCWLHRQVILKVIDVCSWYWKQQAHAVMWSHKKTHCHYYSSSHIHASTLLTSVYELPYYTLILYMQ